MGGIVFFVLVVLGILYYHIPIPASVRQLGYGLLIICGLFFGGSLLIGFVKWVARPPKDTKPPYLIIPDEVRFEHTLIVAPSGHGKTQLIQTHILKDIQDPSEPAVIVIDSQRDMIRKLADLDRYAPKGGTGLTHRYMLIDPRDVEYPPQINLFSVDLSRYDAAAREQVMMGVLETFDYLFSGIVGADLTARQGTLFRYITRLMMGLPETMGRNATMLDVLHFVEDPTPYLPAIQKLPPVARSFFEKQFIGNRAYTQTREQIAYRLHAILGNPTLERFFTAPTTILDLGKAIDRGSLIMIDTAMDFLGKEGSATFGKLWISLILRAIYERAAIPEYKRKTTWLYIDEANAYFDQNIESLLAQARKYKLGCTFAFHHLGQPSPELRASLMTNTATKIVGRVSAHDARAFAAELHCQSDEIMDLPKLKFACFARNYSHEPFYLTVEPGSLEAQPIMDKRQRWLAGEINRSFTSFDPRVKNPLSKPVPRAPTPAPAPAIPQDVDNVPITPSKEW